MAALTGLLVTMKGIPLAYNKDMQEDKELPFDAIDTTKGCLQLFAGMLTYDDSLRMTAWKRVQSTDLQMQQMQQIIL